MVIYLVSKTNYKTKNMAAEDYIYETYVIEYVNFSGLCNFYLLTKVVINLLHVGSYQVL